jgi:cytidylate kinase
VFDRDLVERVLQEHDLPDRMAAFMPEDRMSALADTLDELFGVRPSSVSLVRKTADTILHLAELGNAIIIGRGGNIITRRMPGAVHIRLVGSIERRILHVQEQRQLDPKAAAAYVRDHDLGRKRYVETYYAKDIDDPLLYHLVVNTDRVPYEEAARSIAQAIFVRAERSSTN